MLPKRKFLFLIIGFLILGVLLGIWLVGRLEKKTLFPKKFNIIVIGIDTCRKSHMSCYGYNHPTTPFIDELVRDSILFTNAMSQSPWTLPAFASFFTSTYPSVHGARGKAEDGKFFSIRDGIPSGVEIMAKLGILTKAFINAPFLASVFGFSKGFFEFDYAHGNNARIRRANETIKQAMHWIQENRRKQFFLFIHFFDPHLNYDPPRPPLKRLARQRSFTYQGHLKAPFSLLSEIREKKISLSLDDWQFIKLLYDAEIAFVDENCGRLFYFLQEKRLYEKTLIVVLSDHGEEFLDHDGFEHGHSQYDELLNIPLIIKMPSNFKAGKTISNQVNLIDVMPTLLEMLSAPRPKSFEGKSFLNLITEDKVEEKRPAFSEETHWGEELKSVRTDGFKFIANSNFERQELYDLSADPQEKRNLVEIERERAMSLKEMLLSWIRQNSITIEQMKKEGHTDLDKKFIDNLRSLGYLK